jgi:hypothetical protein
MSSPRTTLSAAAHIATVRNGLDWCEGDCTPEECCNPAAAALDALAARIDTLETFASDLAKHGTRFDTNPTVKIHNTPEWIASQEWWQNRATEMDVSVRNRARAALADGTKETEA